MVAIAEMASAARRSLRGGERRRKERRAERTRGERWWWSRAMSVRRWRVWWRFSLLMLLLVRWRERASRMRRMVESAGEEGFKMTDRAEHRRCESCTEEEDEAEGRSWSSRAFTILASIIDFTVRAQREIESR